MKVKLKFNIFDIIPFSASKKYGLEKLNSSLSLLVDSNLSEVNNNCLNLSSSNKKLLNPLFDILNKNLKLPEKIVEDLSLSIFSSESFCNKLFFDSSIKSKLLKDRENILSTIDKGMLENIRTMESDLRYGFIDEVLYDSEYKKNKKVKLETTSEKIDKVLTHSIFGPMIYIGLLYFVFQLQSFYYS